MATPNHDLTSTHDSYSDVQNSERPPQNEISSPNSRESRRLSLGEVHNTSALAIQLDQYPRYEGELTIQRDASRPGPEIATGQEPWQAIVPINDSETVTPLNLLGEQPEYIDCPFCERRTQTRVVKSDSSTTNIAAVLCCLFCVCLTCVPSMAGWYQDVQHFCTGCGHRVTFRPHGGRVEAFEPNAEGKVKSQYASTGVQTTVEPPGNKGEQVGPSQLTISNAGPRSATEV